MLSVIHALAEFDTALLANTLGFIDPTPPHEIYMGSSVRSVTPSIGPSVGVAVTAELDTSTPHNPGDAKLWWELLSLIEKTPEPTILVVKTVGSRPDHECVLGDGTAKILHSVGCIAMVTDGGVRDVSGLLTVPFAAYCRGVTIHHCALRWTRISAPVEVGGITVRPGDLLHANAEGVIKIPPASLNQLSDRAVQMRAYEHCNHIHLRQTGLSPEAKRLGGAERLKAYGFGQRPAPIKPSR